VQQNVPHVVPVDAHMIPDKPTFEVDKIFCSTALADNKKHTSHIDATKDSPEIVLEAINNILLHMTMISHTPICLQTQSKI
jgi:hypothetical protein